MSALAVIGLVLFCCGLVAAPLCFKLSKMHKHASIQAQCISDMLLERDHGRQEMIAAQARLDMIENGTWRSE